MDSLTPTDLRSRLYRILDRVLETGQPATIRRGARTLQIVPDEAARRPLDHLPKRRARTISADALVATRWEWDSDLPAPVGEVAEPPTPDR